MTWLRTSNWGGGLCFEMFVNINMLSSVVVQMKLYKAGRETCFQVWQFGNHKIPEEIIATIIVSFISSFLFL